MLYRGSVEPQADLGEQCFAFVPLGAVDAYIDQLMGLEAAVDFGENGLAEALLADAGDGMQVVGAGAQGTALG